MPDFDKYIVTVEKRTVKISLPPDTEALKKAFWAGFKYCEELNNLKNDLGGNNTNGFNDIFKEMFGGKK